MSRPMRRMAFGVLGVVSAIALSLIHAPTTVSSPVVPTADSAPFTGEPQYDQVDVLKTQIGADPADVYLPVVPADQLVERLPVALMLPGALVDPSEYSQFAQIVAQYGFVVIVPSHERSLPEIGISGELAEAGQVTEVLDYVRAASTDPESPLVGKVNPDKMALLGHSHGGAVGLLAIADVCIEPFFCVGSFNRPPEVVAGVFYGVNTYNPETQSYMPTPNAGIPVALVQGTQDGVATVEEASQTFDLIDSPPKALIMVEGANHFGITNQNNPTGARPDASIPTLDQPQSIETIAQWTAYFLRGHVLQDRDALNYIYNGGDQQDVRVTVKAVPPTVEQR